MNELCVVSYLVAGTTRYLKVTVEVAKMALSKGVITGIVEYI